MPWARRSVAKRTVSSAVQPPLLQPVGGRDAEEQRLVVGPHLPYGVHDFEGESGAVLVGAAVGVGAVVGVRGEELVDQVAVGAVDLGDLETGGQGPACGVRELAHDLPDLISGQLGRHRVLVVEGDRARRECLPPVCVRADRRAALPGPVGRGLAAGVCELDSRHRALRDEEARDAAEGLDLGVVPDAEVVRRDTALGRDAGGLDDDQPGAAGRAGRVVREVPVVRCAGLRAFRGGRVLAHRGHPDPVRDGHIAQGDGLEEGAHGELLRSRGTEGRLVR